MIRVRRGRRRAVAARLRRPAARLHGLPRRARRLRRPRHRLAAGREAAFIDLDGLLGQPQPDTKVYCCGPEPLLTAVEQRCAAWPQGSLHVERFVAKPLTEPVLHEAFEVHLAQSDLTLTVPPDTSILDVDRTRPESASCPPAGKAPAAPARPPSSTAIPDHRDSVLDQEARDANDCMMICVSRACTPRLVLDL